MSTGVYIPLQDVDFSNLFYVGKYKHVPSHCVSVCTDTTTLCTYFVLSYTIL